MINIEGKIDQNADHAEIRIALEKFIIFLNEESGIPMKSIVAEMLSFSANALRYDEKCSVEFVSTEDDAEEDDDYDYDDEAFELKYAQKDIKGIKRDIKKLEREIEKGNINSWDIDSLEGRLEIILDECDESIIDKLVDDINEVKEALIPLQEKAEIVLAENKLRESSSRIIQNITSVKSIVSDVDEATSILDKKGMLTPELKEAARLTKERCCSYRAKKKMLDAEVAENSGNIKKADKLKAEAQALLMQDWRLIMKDENFPNINYI